MELEDLKNAWDNARVNEKNPAVLTPEMITQMTKRKYYTKVKPIAYSEIGGTIIILFATVYVCMNFYRLDSILLQVVGTTAILLLLCISAISAYSLWRLNLGALATRSYKETLETFATRQLQFLKMQKINISLSYLLLVTAIVLLSKLVSGKDISGHKLYWILSFTFGYLSLSYYSKWVLKFYEKKIQQSHEILQALTND